MKKNKQVVVTHCLMTGSYESMNVETMQNGFLKFCGPSFGQG
jgi:hypothetical protein